jgi:hypothetical protein
MALRHTHLPDAGAVTSPPWALSLLRLQNPILTVFSPNAINCFLQRKSDPRSVHFLLGFLDCIFNP